jgi:uncharacterized membrane protein
MSRRARVKSWIERGRESLWPVPGTLVLGSVLLAVLTVVFDRAIGVGLPDARVLFRGTAEGARAILSTIAASLATVVSVAFSVMMIALQQAASRYSPRVLQQFTRDRGNKVVLGTHIGTFVFALLVLTQVREETPEAGAQIPTFSIAMAILLALISLGMLVYFLHHSIQSLRVEHILSAIRHETMPELAKHFPRSFGEPHQDPPSTPELVRDLIDGRGLTERVVRANREGYLRLMDEEGLITAVPPSVRVAVVPVRVGQFVYSGQVLARLLGEGSLEEGDWTERVQAAFELGTSRSLQQDPLYGVRQIVDIALKALSPGINDPTTAEQSLEHLGAMLVFLADRDLPEPVRVTEQGTTFVLERPSFGDYVERSFSQIRQVATSTHVHRHLLDVLAAVATRVQGRGRLEHLRAEVGRIAEAADRLDGSADEKQRLRERAAEVARLVERAKRHGSSREGDPSSRAGAEAGQLESL